MGGRGELIEPIEPREDFHLVVLFPGQGSPTSKAYAAIDAEAAYDDADWDARLTLAKAFREGPASWPFRNRFESSVSRSIPKIREALAALRDTGAIFTAMSGSGSACFGVYCDSVAADTSARKLEGSYSFVSRCSPLARLPEPVLE